MMHDSTIRRPFAAALTLAAALVLLSQGAFGQGAAAAFPLASKGASFASGTLSPFAKESLASFATFTLSNGIPVIVKKNPANQVRNIQVVLRGGCLLASAATAGWEKIALQTMARGSAKYKYDDIKSLLDETSSAIGATTSFEYSTYSLNTLDKYFARLFPVWVDTFIAPSFAKEDFDQILSQARLALQNKEKNPWDKTALVTNDAFFKGHPYANSFDGNKASFDAATLDAVKAWFTSQFSANRLYIVAVGNFDPDSLRKDLEKAMGGIADKKLALPAPAPAFAAPGPMIKFEYPASKGLGYVRGDFPTPAPSDPNFMPLNLGLNMLDDLLMNIVRDKYGAVYTPGSYMRANNANYGSITMFKTKVAGMIKSYIDEAVASFAVGKVLSVDPTKSSGSEPRMELADALPIYKAQYINTLYEKQATNAATAGQIINSVTTSGDYRSYLLDVDRINAATPEQVVTAMKRYVLEGKFAWVILGSSDVLLPVVSSDFEGFKIK